MVNSKDFLNNRADFAKTAEEKAQAQEQSCERCNDPLLFAMQDKEHQFSIGLLTILECLKVAENQGHVPQLPDSWWTELEMRFASNYHLLE